MPHPAPALLTLYLHIQHYTACRHVTSDADDVDDDVGAEEEVEDELHPQPRLQSL